jgi:N utilization substance protein B
MGARSRAREIALQLLFQYEWNSDYNIEQVLQEYVNGLLAGKRSDNVYTLDFARRCISGVIERREELDSIIARHAQKWRIGRMAKVDRNILRLGVYEIVYAGDIPARVAVNEAVELAKRFGTDESGSFVNGILDSVLKNEDGAEKSGGKYPVP